MDANAKEKSHNVKFAEGGHKNHMLGGHGPVTGKGQVAGEQKPGVTEHDTSGGESDKYACGGSGKMFGFSPSLPAKGGITSAR